MNRIICLGEEIDDIAKEVFGVEGNFKVAVYRYETGSYEGSGELVVKTIDNKYWLQDLGHCSCYGPLDKWSYPIKKYDKIKDVDCSAEWLKNWDKVIRRVNKEAHDAE